MASNKVTLNLTGDQQKQMKDATGKTVAQLNIDLTSVMDKPKFSCSKCGDQTLNAKSEVNTYDDLIGAVCTNCGTTLTEGDTRQQALKIAEDAMRDSVGKADFKYVN